MCCCNVNNNFAALLVASLERCYRKKKKLPKNLTTIIQIVSVWFLLLQIGWHEKKIEECMVAPLQ